MESANGVALAASRAEGALKGKMQALEARCAFISHARAHTHTHTHTQC